MKNKKLVLTFSIVLFFLSSCHSGSALKYNNSIIELQNEVIKKMISLADSFKTRNPELMRKKLKELQDQATKSANMLSKIKEFKGGENLYNAALDLFEFYESVCMEEFSEMVRILAKKDPEITDSDRSYIMELQKSIEADEAELDRKLQFEQRNFASKYNFRIGTNKYQKRINNL